MFSKQTVGCSFTFSLYFRTSKYGRADAADDSTQRHGATRATSMEQMICGDIYKL